MARKRADGYRFAFITYTEQNVRIFVFWSVFSYYLLQITVQSTNKCLHFVASGNTHVILGEAVRVKEKNLKVEEKKRKRKKSKKDSSTIESAAPASEPVLVQSLVKPPVPSSAQCPVQSSVQASPVSNSSHENHGRIPTDPCVALSGNSLTGSKRPLLNIDRSPVENNQLLVAKNPKRFKNAENVDEKV